MSNLPPTLPLVSAEPPNTTTGAVRLTFEVPSTVHPKVAPRIQTVYSVNYPPPPVEFNYKTYLNDTKVTARYIPPSLAPIGQQSRWQ